MEDQCQCTWCLVHREGKTTYSPYEFRVKLIKTIMPLLFMNVAEKMLREMNLPSINLESAKEHVSNYYSNTVDDSKRHDDNGTNPRALLDCFNEDVTIRQNELGYHTHHLIPFGILSSAIAWVENFYEDVVSKQLKADASIPKPLIFLGKISIDEYATYLLTINEGGSLPYNYHEVLENRTSKNENFFTRLVEELTGDLGDDVLAEFESTVIDTGDRIVSLDPSIPTIEKNRTVH